MKFFTFLSIFFISVIGIQSQNMRLGFETGIGDYQMSDLKSLMKEAVEENELHPHITNNYPAYLFFQPSVVFVRERCEWGFNFTLQSTGGRASIRDYSGDYRFDNKVVGFAPAIFREMYIIQNKKLDMLVGADFGAVYTKLEFKEYFRLLSDVYVNESADAMSLNFFIKPHLKTSYLLKSKLRLFGDFGYHFDVWEGGISEPMGIRSYFRYVGDKGEKVQWKGLRIGVGCTYQF